MHMTELRKIRKAKKLSMQKLANLAGVSKETIYSNESGRTTNPNQSSVDAIARVLGVTPFDLFFPKPTDENVNPNNKKIEIKQWKL